MPRLDALLQPRSIAVIGASPRENTLGNNVVVNLRRYGYAGSILPVHPSAPEVAGLPAFRSAAVLPEAPDCAVLAVSADKVLASLEEGVAHGLKAAVIFASGFAELGDEGRARQRELQDFCARTGLLVCGPNCLGLVNVHQRVALYSSGIPETMRDGGLAVVSHSGSACIALSTLGRFGMSYMISVGNAAVLDMADYLGFLADDANTRVVALFMETLRDPDAFAAGVEAVHRAGKQVVVLKVGRSAKGAAASAAHTGSLAGNWDAYEAYFRRHGVISVDDFDEMCESIELGLKLARMPRGDGVAVIAVSGGETSLVADIADRAGVRLPDLAPDTVRQLKGVLPAFGSVGNPLDTTDRGVYDSQNVYAGAIRALATDPAISMIAVVQDCSPGLSTRGANNYRRIAQTVADASREVDLPIAFFNTTAGGLHPHVVEPFAGTQVAVMQGARASLLAIRRLIEHAAFAPAPMAAAIPPQEIWLERLRQGAALTERESKQFLAAHGIAVTRELPARDADEAAAAAASIGYPVVMKVESADIPHKTEAGGVRIGISDEAAARRAWAEIIASARRYAPAARIDGVVVQECISGGVETIAGLSRQEPFGMGVVFGAGGVLVELLKDAALALAPFGVDEARALIDRTRAGRLVGGYRGGKAGDVAALAGLLAQLSAIGTTYAEHLEAVDLNPVSVLPQGQGVRVLDALVIPRKNT
ncbi:MAG: acetate--CoA ligase family protein [Burkholderiales bacterium]